MEQLDTCQERALLHLLMELRQQLIELGAVPFSGNPFQRADERVNRG